MNNAKQINGNYIINAEVNEAIKGYLVGTKVVGNYLINEYAKKIIDNLIAKGIITEDTYPEDINEYAENTFDDYIIVIDQLKGEDNKAYYVAGVDNGNTFYFLKNEATETFIHDQWMINFKEYVTYAEYEIA